MTDLRTVKARARISKPRGKPYFAATSAPGVSLGYRKLVDRAGSWCARIADGKGGNRLEALGLADDLESANGHTVLDYSQAHAAAIKVVRVPELEGRLTVARALEEYAAGNKDRHAGNVSRVRYWLGEAAPGLLDREVTALTVGELTRWRDAIAAAPATVNRTIRILSAALTGAAERYPEQVTNANVWRVGLKQKKHDHNPRNVVLSDEQVRALVHAAYELDPAFGLFLEVGAVTGARPSQIVRLEVGNLKFEPTLRLMMPTSKKGTGSKPRHLAVPITAPLADKLRQAGAGRGPSEPLLVRTKGDAWSATSSDHREPFERAVKLAALEHPQRVTFYALRHSSIVRRIMLGVPLRLIAAIHDTSTGQIERHYSAYIDQYGDTGRVGLLDLEPPRPDNVVALRG